jgi:flagellin-like protein
MNKLNFRNRKKGITPVIATIILIAGTLVLALVVGAYTFGLFGSNVKTVTTSSLIINSGIAAVPSTTQSCSGANLAVTMNNPGGLTYVTGVSLTSGSGAVPLTYFLSSPTSCTSETSPFGATVFPVNGGGLTSVTVYFGTPLSSGILYNYVISLSNGQTVQGSLTAS